MKHKLCLLLTVILLLCGSSLALAVPDADFPWADSQDNNSGKGHGAQPETPLIVVQPKGVSMEIATTSFWLEVQASVSDGGQLSYQWYSSTVNDIATVRPLYDAADPTFGTERAFIPEQELGTVYFCVQVTNTLGGDSVSVYSDLVEVTFVGKSIRFADVRGIDAPVAGAAPDLSADRFTDDVLNEYYGFDIDSLSWQPNDAVFQPGTEYTVTVNIRFWPEAVPTDDYHALINEQPATDVLRGSSTYAFSYTFPATAAAAEQPPTDEPPLPDAQPEQQPAADDADGGGLGLTGLLIILALFVCALVAVVLLLVKGKK